MQGNIYTLPEINMVGGATRNLYFNLKDKDGNVFDAEGCMANFAVCNYADKQSTPLFTITPDFMADEKGTRSIVHVPLDTGYTRELYGKYVYQITLKNTKGEIGIPNQGILNITRNIDQTYIA